MSINCVIVKRTVSPVFNVTLKSQKKKNIRMDVNVTIRVQFCLQ